MNNSNKQFKVEETSTSLDGKTALTVWSDKVESDARLIAAAPEMLEALEKALQIIDRYQLGLAHEAVIRDGYKLIAKARGES